MKRLLHLVVKRYAKNTSYELLLGIYDNVSTRSLFFFFFFWGGRRASAAMAMHPSENVLGWELALAACSLLLHFHPSNRFDRAQSSEKHFFYVSIKNVKRKN